MGLSASEARLLMLTTRLSNNTLEQTLISQRQMRLAWDSDKEAKEYNEAMSNMKLVMKVNDSNETTGYRKTDLNYKDMTSMGYVVTDALGRIYLTKENDNWVVPKASNLSDSKIFDGDVKTDENGKPTISLQGKTYEVVDGTSILEDKAKLQNNIMSGLLFVLNTTGNDTAGMALNDLEANTSIEWVYDTSDDAAAESKHNSETRKISRQDQILTLELKQLETESQALTKEMEAIEKVIKNNIDRTFDLFNGKG